jgi:hypothetical protein
LSPKDYLRPAATSFLQMTNICRLLKCKNFISEAYNFGGLIFYLLVCVARETEKITEAPPVRKQKTLLQSGLYGHTLHQILYITNYPPFRQGKRALFFKEFTFDISIKTCEKVGSGVDITSERSSGRGQLCPESGGNYKIQSLEVSKVFYEELLLKKGPCFHASTYISWVHASPSISKALFL